MIVEARRPLRPTLAFLQLRQARPGQTERFRIRQARGTASFARPRAGDAGHGSGGPIILC